MEAKVESGMTMRPPPFWWWLVWGAVVAHAVFLYIATRASGGSSDIEYGSMGFRPVMIACVAWMLIRCLYIKKAYNPIFTFFGFFFGLIAVDAGWLMAIFLGQNRLVFGLLACLGLLVYSPPTFRMGIGKERTRRP